MTRHDMIERVGPQYTTDITENIEGKLLELEEITPQPVIRIQKVQNASLNSLPECATIYLK